MEAFTFQKSSHMIDRMVKYEQQNVIENSMHALLCLGKRIFCVTVLQE